MVFYSVPFFINSENCIWPFDSPREMEKSILGTIRPKNNSFRITTRGSVKSYAQNYFYGLVEIYYIYYRGRLDRPLVTIQRSGHKVSRAAQPLVLSLTLWELTAYLPGDLIALHGFQVLHVHVLLVAPLGAGYMSQSGTDQHQGRISIRERPHHTGPAADFTV